MVQSTSPSPAVVLFLCVSRNVFIFPGRRNFYFSSITQLFLLADVE